MRLMRLFLSIVAICCITIAWSDDKIPQDEDHGGKHYGIEDHDQWIKVKRALYLVDQHSYYNAIDILEEVSKELPDNEFVAYQLAELYYQVRDPKNAVIYYAKICDPKKGKYPKAFFDYGECLMQLGQYQEAKNQFHTMTRYRDRSRSVEVRDLKKRAAQRKRSCDYAIAEIDKDTAFVDVEILPGSVNKAYTDFSPMVNGDTLIFASLREDSIISYKYGEEKFFPVKLYQSVKQEDAWQEPTEFWNINHTVDHTANGVYSPDHEAFYFTRCHANHHNEVICAIYSKRKNEAGEWGKAHKLHKRVNLPGHTSTQPTFGEITRKRRGKVLSQKVLYFVSDRPGGEGGKDLWYSILDADGKVSRPINCGKRINTLGDEVSPYYDSENELMYFSSNYHYGIGGMDIQVSKGSTKKWRSPTNIGIPWNSSYDDTYYVPSKGENTDLATGYLVSNRPGGHALKSETCCDDIYSFDEYLPEIGEIKGKIVELVKELPVIVAKDSLDNVTASVDTNITVNLDSAIASNPLDSVTRKAQSAEREIRTSLADARVGFVRQRHVAASTIEGEVDMDELAQYVEWVDTTDESGEFYTRLYKERQYSIVVERDEYEPELFEVDWNRENNLDELEIVVEKIIKDTLKKEVEDENKTQSFADVMHKEEFEKNEKFILENMYFDTNLDQIKKSSEPSLKLLLTFMEKKEDVKIEISGHTDSRGDDDYNLDLSQRRAESVKRYLEENGIDGRRIVAKGYGETTPIEPNEKPDGSDNPAGRRKNRRTEVVILSSGKHR